MQGFRELSLFSLYDRCILEFIHIPNKLRLNSHICYQARKNKNPADEFRFLEECVKSMQGKSHIVSAKDDLQKEP